MFSNKTCVAELILLILFVPQASFGLFYGVVVIFTFGVTFTLKDTPKNQSIHLFAFLASLVLFSMIYKVMMCYSLYDIKEFIKILLFFIVYYSIKKKSLYKLEHYFLFYITVDFIISVSQFFHLEAFTLKEITSLYSTENHASTA